jgi:hypothetical protein
VLNARRCSKTFANAKRSPNTAPTTMKEPKIWAASIRHEYDQNNGNEGHVQDQKNHRGIK